VRTQACAAAAPFREAVDVMTALYGARSMYRRSGRYGPTAIASMKTKR
jgi:hypothetical protein